MGKEAWAFAFLVCVSCGGAARGRSEPQANVVVEARTPAIEPSTSAEAIAPGQPAEVHPREWTSESGLHVVEVKVGTGVRVVPGCTVWINCTTAVLGEPPFDTPEHGPFKFKLGGGTVVKGVDEGVEGMRVGGQRKLIVPPSLGYGDRPVRGNTPGGSTLVFDVELVRVDEICERMGGD